MILRAYLHGEHAGNFIQDNAGIWFEYDDGYAVDIPVSISLPKFGLTKTGKRRQAQRRKVENFLWGLLPDNPRRLDAIARDTNFGGPCSPQSVMQLIRKVGADCAGALQIVAPEDVDQIVRDGGADWLTEKQIADNLSHVIKTGSVPGSGDHPGAFSLPGAQPKIALLKKDGRWFQPWGSIPSTHIFKPATMNLDGLVENEHLCLETAAEMGLTTTRSEIAHFGEHAVIVVERYDRIVSGNSVLRIHQEDMCQALGLHPRQKYESDDGPGIVQIDSILMASRRAQEDRLGFMKAIIFNFLIEGTDAHAKNYSILHGRHGFRLAPLYDIASYLPYHDGKHPRMPMKVAGKREYGDVAFRHWRQLARTLRLGEDLVVDMLWEMAHQLPEAMTKVATRCRSAGLKAPILNKVLDGVASRCADQLKRWKLDPAAPPVPRQRA